MTKFTRRSLIKFLYISIDVFFIGFSLFVASWVNEGKLAFDLNIRTFFLSEVNAYRTVFFSWFLILILFCNSYGLYQTRRDVLEGIELWLVVKSVLLSSLTMAVFIYITKTEGFPRSIFIVATLFNIIFLFAWRYLKRRFVESLVASGYNNDNVLIVGAGKIGLLLQEEMQRRPGLGLKVIGFLDDFKTNDLPHSQVKILGKLSDFVDVARREFVHKVFITIHPDSQVFLKLLEDAKDINIDVRVVPQGFGLTSGEFHKFNIGIVPVLEYCDTESTRRQVGKRLFDFLVSFLTILVSWPLFLFIAMTIKLDSPGPIFYASRRYGRHGKIFHMYKFRSMHKDAEQDLAKLRDKNEADGPIFKMKDDPRITRVGVFLRKYSMDELPQIFNVLKGEMSMVGPRPFPIDQIEKEDLKQLKRLEVRPGMTGLWQIRGRSDLAFSRLIKWDIWYINNWSFWLDIYIMFQTIPIVVEGKGAY